MDVSSDESSLESLGILCCPRCNGEFIYENDDFKCADCGHSYEVIDGIPRLFSPNEWDASKNDVTEKMKSFYEDTPFPNYDDFDSAASLLDKARQGIFAKLLDDQVPFNTRILECGCGTGQLTNFLSIANRKAIGTDMCLNSLGLAHSFKIKNNLKRAQFYQMNLFKPCFKPESFDLVISNGVLHHTSDPFLAFKSISTLVKPKGYILIGLYHKTGRLITDLRRFIFNATKDKLKFLDPRTISKDISEAKRRAWFMDQYKNPHESKHTVGEVCKWLEETNFQFISSLPKTKPFHRVDESTKLFKREELGNLMERFLVNIGMIFTGPKEGGFFIVIAKKK